MKISHLAMLLVGTALTSCTAQQQATAATDAQTICTDIAAAEKLDPAFATHNPTLAADAAKICGVVAITAP